MSIGKGAMPRTKHLEVSFLKRLKNFELPEGLFEDCETLRDDGCGRAGGLIVDNPKMTELHIPEGCFPSLKYMSIQGGGGGAA